MEVIETLLQDVQEGRIAPERLVKLVAALQRQFHDTQQQFQETSSNCGTHSRNLRQPGNGSRIEAFPATDLDPDKPPEAPAVLLNREFGITAGKLYLYRITWSGKKASISEVQTIPLSRTYLSAALQLQAVQPAPGAKLRGDEGRRTLSVFARGGSVFGCNTAKRTGGGRCGIPR